MQEKHQTLALGHVMQGFTVLLEPAKILKLNVGQDKPILRADTVLVVVALR